MPRTKPVRVDADPAVQTLDGLATRVMAELRDSLAELLASAGEPVARAVDVERVFRLDKTLSWQVFRLSQSADLADAGNVPSRTAVRRLAESARRRRVPRPVIERVNLAFEEFERLVEVHGGDRAGLMSMVSGFLGEKSQQYDLKIRKSVFRGLAHLWGVHARMVAHTAIFMPRRIIGDQRYGHLTMVTADIGLAHRFQTEPLITHRWLWTHDEATPRPGAGESGGAGPPIDHGPQLLPEFSTHPLPKVSRGDTMYGARDTELVFPPGLANAVSLYSMHRRENFPTPAAEGFFFQMIFRLPMEAVVWELLVPAGWSTPSSARAAIYGCRTNPDRAYEERTGDLLPQRATLDYLGTSEHVPALPGDPRHAAAVRHAIQESGWSGTRFDIYRCRVEFPLMFTMLVVRVDAAKR